MLGVNEAGHESGNDLMCDSRDLPWLQDTPDTHVWDTWGIDFRDVVVVNGDLQPVGVFNLTEHDLGDPDSYDTLRDMLVEAATP